MNVQEIRQGALSTNWEGVWFMKDTIGFRDKKINQVIYNPEIYIEFKTLTRCNGMWFFIVPDQISGKEYKVKMVVASIFPSPQLDYVQETAIGKKWLGFCDLRRHVFQISGEFCENYYKEKNFRIRNDDAVTLCMWDEENFGKQFGFPEDNVFSSTIEKLTEVGYEKLVKQFQEESKQVFSIKAKEET